MSFIFMKILHLIIEIKGEGETRNLKQALCFGVARRESKAYYLGFYPIIALMKEYLKSSTSFN